MSIKSVLTPSPTCLPGQGGSRKGDAAIRQRNGSHESVALLSELKEGFFMTSDTSASLQFLEQFCSGQKDRSGPLPPDASYIGAWDLDVGIDTLHEALFLFRGERQDLLWAFTSGSAEATG